MKKCFAILGCVWLFWGCTVSGPQQTLDDTARALEQKNSAAFLANLDMQAYTKNYLKNKTNIKGLSSLNSLGKMFGLDNIDSMLNNFINNDLNNLINNFLDIQGELKDDFVSGVSSGEIILQCKKSESPDCPWIPEALRKAKIVEINDNSAIAQITTPMNLASWLALAKVNGKWQIVGQAVLENDAKGMAQEALNPEAEKNPGEKQSQIPEKAAPIQKNFPQHTL